jgi:outer membrane lipoprotein carrier protein
MPAFAGLLLALTVPAALLAASTPPLDEILDQTERRYAGMEAFSAEFRQYTTSAAASAMMTEAEGRLYHMKPRRMRWEYQTPESQVFVANNGLAWLYVPEDAQITLFEADRFFSSPLARALLEGIPELEKHFRISLDATRTNSVKAVLDLEPRREDPQVQSVVLWIDLDKYQIVRVETRDALGNLNRLVIEAQEAAPGLDADLFKLEIPEGTMVVGADGQVMESSEIRKLKERLIPDKE